METIMKPPFFCFCGKQFSSGKAMGGHKKVHSRKLRRSENDGPRARRSPSPSPNPNNLKGGAVISARTENGKPNVPPKKRKLIMEDEDEKNSPPPPPPAAAERYFCSICGVDFQRHRSLSAHNGHHTKAARKLRKGFSERGRRWVGISVIAETGPPPPPQDSPEVMAGKPRPPQMRTEMELIGLDSI
nr:zinc finger protein ZAT2-like [Ipomoea batatas]